MTKREKLIKWASKRGWFYLCEVPYQSMGMTRATTSSALIHFCERGVMDFRIQGIKQYRIRPGEANA